MIVFKGYMRIIKRNIWTILMYVFIFMGIAKMIQTSLGSSIQAQGFVSQKTNVAVMNRDGSALGDALEKLMEEKQNLVFVEDDLQVMQEEMYYGNLDYIVVVPEGAQEQLQKSAAEQTEIVQENADEQAETVQENADEQADMMQASVTDADLTAGLLECVSVPDAVETFYVESQSNMFLNQVSIYLSAGYEVEEACSHVLALGEQTPAVTLMDTNGNSGERKDYAYYFGYMPYAFLGSAIMALSLIIMEFKKKDIRRRMESSAVPFTTQNIAAFAACMIVGIMIWGICILANALFYNGGVFRDPNAGYYLLNSVCCLLVALSLGYLAGMISTGPATMNGITNILSLGLCFLGGVMVPLEMLGGTVRKVAQFLPTYWYSTVNGLLADYSELSPQIMKTIRQGYLIQVLFAAAALAIALLVKKVNQQERG